MVRRYGESVHGGPELGQVRLKPAIREVRVRHPNRVDAGDRGQQHQHGQQAGPAPLDQAADGMRQRHEEDQRGAEHHGERNQLESDRAPPQGESEDQRRDGGPGRGQKDETVTAHQEGEILRRQAPA